jgi:adenosylcobinamide-GDP ribazoletransferase
MTGSAAGGLRLAVSLLTVAPVRVGRLDRVDRETVGWAMVLAPATGLIVGGGGAVVLAAGEWLGLGSLVSAALAVAAMAALTRGLHLDGLADVADGLGSGRPAAAALAIMKKSDIGPFGVITLVLTLVIQVAAVAEAPAAGVIVAAVAGRLAVTWACREAVPAARPDGLGHLVASTVRPSAAIAAVAAVIVLAAAAGFVSGGRPWVVLMPGAVLAGLAAAMVVLRHAVRRLGGVTGDVLGALVEIATTAALVTMALD